MATASSESQVSKAVHREALLQAVLRLTLEFGPRGFSMQQLAQHSGLSPSTVFRTISKDALMSEFWDWCWETFMTKFARRVLKLERSDDALKTLLDEMDPLWDMGQVAADRDIAFLCFVFYRREAELLPDSGPLKGRVEFEENVSRLCRKVVDQCGANVSEDVLTVWVMNWCASTMMAWHYQPETIETITAGHARLGLQNIISGVLTDRQPHAA